MNANLPTTQEPSSGSGAMFDRIAERYDFMNRLMSFGLDLRWRKKLLAALELAPGHHLLDVATGTADVALDACKAVENLQVTGLDPSAGMLGVGQRKVIEQQRGAQITLVEGDALDMPFDDNTFESSCVSFGIRNFPDRLQGLREMTRCVKPGGRVAVLELSEPRGGLLSPFTRFHIHKVVPLLGALLAGDREYAYLAKSIQAFPPAPEFAQLMEEAGLENVRFEPMSFRVAHLYVGTKPKNPA